VEYFKARRFLVSFDTSRLPQVFTDVLVIGTGVGGLRSALAAAEHGNVLLLAKQKPTESNTSKAQGGVAAVMAADDSIDAHIADTLSAGQGVCDTEVVRTVTGEAAERIDELIQWGGQFDMDGDSIALTREGGHSAARIAHAMGDATGREVANTLLGAVSKVPAIRMMANAFVLDLLVSDDNECLGAVMQDERGIRMVVWAKQTILATGGAGHIFRETTNSAIATGDGLAMAFRAGVELCDLEYYQFHPTALYVAGAARALISEAVRGEGGLLVNARGERFMPRYHELAELAPRDTVSRSIVTEVRETGHTCVYLDVRHIEKKHFQTRFPGIFKLCESFDLDVSKDLIPVRPAAHYMIGGVKTDAEGRTSISRLWASGEIACTGLHGANRLGSNSLLEGLVFGYHSGEAAGKLAAGETAGPRHPRIKIQLEAETDEIINVADVTNAMRATAWRNLGIERSSFHIEEARHMMQFWGRYVYDKEFQSSAGWELQNMLLVSSLFANSALMRTESRGVHYRTDFPKIDDDNWKVRIIAKRGDDLRTVPVTE